VRLAGEQALLSRDLRNLNAEQQRDLLALRNLLTEIAPHTDWHRLAGQASQPAAANGHRPPAAGSAGQADGHQLNDRQRTFKIQADQRDKSHLGPKK